jgi:hypothetical protein
MAATDGGRLQTRNRLPLTQQTLSPMAEADEAEAGAAVVAEADGLP